MQRKTYAILGIPIDDVSMEEAVEKILFLIDDYSKKPFPRYVSTVNVDFLSNIHSWNIIHLRYREFYDVIANSDLATADGMPLVWLSQCLGNPLKRRVAGADLLIALIKALEQQEKSVFFLGGTEKINHDCTLFLQNQHPKLKIAGAACPFISITGENLDVSVERDALIIEQINLSNPDVLFLNLGSPKQEIWFNRIRNRLKVPVTLGIGGAFAFASHAIPRAPKKMQDFGLEWFYRFYQEPKRLFKRYLLDSIKFSYMAAPLLLFHYINLALCKIRPNFSPEHICRLFLSHDKAIIAVYLPPLLDEHACNIFEEKIEDFLAHDSIIIDFKRLRHMDLRGIAFLLDVLKRAKKEKKELVCWGITGDVRFFLQLNRAWNSISEHNCNSLNDLIDRLSVKTLFHSIQQKHNIVELNILGGLNNSLDYDGYLQKLAPILHDKSCLLDLSYCPCADNRSFQFLLKLRKEAVKSGKSLKLCGLNHSLKQEFRMANLEKVFDIRNI